MSLSKPIGGYFELELYNETLPRSENLKLLNSGRNCLRYILKTNNTKHVYVPKYTCDAILEIIDSMGIKFSFYPITKRLEVKEAIHIRRNELIIYTNYFGIKDEYCNYLSTKYGDRLVIDSCQAFYFKPPIKGHTFYSPRKFFGVPDGGILFTNKKVNEYIPSCTSYQRFAHLLKRIDVGAEAAYADYLKNEKSFKNEPLCQMSPLTAKLLSNIDLNSAKKIRTKNFNFLHKHLNSINEFTAITETFEAPLIYPFMTNDKLIKQRLTENKIFTATYWPNVLEWCKKTDIEYNLANNLIPLPIDQRYGTEEMESIVGIIMNKNNQKLI